MHPTIMIVDDAKDWRDILAGLLGDVYPDAEILTAPSMDEARHLLSQHSVDLAVLDIRFDDSDEDNVEGLELMELIHAQYPNTRTLMITGYGTIKAVERAMKPGDDSQRPAIDFVEKAKIPTEFLPHVEQALKITGA